MKKAEESFLEIDGKKIPLKIYREWRRNVRVSMGKNSVILRMPSAMNISQQMEQIAWCRTWVVNQLGKNDNLQNRYVPKNYSTGDNLQVGSRTYLLNVSHSDNKTHSARLINGEIYLSMNKEDEPAHLQKSMKLLISRIIGQDFHPAILRRVNELNRLYFQKPVQNVRLKYNRSNWGSCSIKGNVNLSTRLLFAPEEVIDYVIIHELAHMIEMNHSSRFWKIVSDAMPDYKLKEEWLKKNGHLCDF
ncbi:MAG: putative metal-dependent hydrolase [Saprospiraceae bacterium]|jgi:predicted metal-dependent hydrolase